MLRITQKKSAKELEHYRLVRQTFEEISVAGGEEKGKGKGKAVS